MKSDIDGIVENEEGRSLEGETRIFVFARPDKFVGEAI
jgi:hypothetical protein